MATVIRQIEAPPESYPDLGSPSPLSAAAQAISLPAVWRRIESYIAHRWTPRDAQWVIEGRGSWLPPLAPATIGTVEVWCNGEWLETADVGPSPDGGLWFRSDGPWRVTAVVGGGSPQPEPPEVVIEAVRRLAEHWAAKQGSRPGASSERIHAGSVELSFDRNPSWMARALQDSGAADLLRPFRRA